MLQKRHLIFSLEKNVFEFELASGAR
jgi:hypothetical protein